MHMHIHIRIHERCGGGVLVFEDTVDSLTLKFQQWDGLPSTP